MFIFESKNYQSLEKDSITGKNVIEFCAKVLDYNNQIDVNETDTTKYNIKFIDIDGNIMCEISEDAVVFAITGEIDNETDAIKEESTKFWELSHKKVISIEFNNPIHKGDGIWDNEYHTDYVSDLDSDEDQEDHGDVSDDEEYTNEINSNVLV